MRRRIYFVLPDKASADKIEQELLLARIDDNHIHFMATVALDGLPQASLLQSSDLTHGMMLGLVSGGLAGAAVGLLLMLYPQAGQGPGLGLIFVLAFVGALFGIWAASLIAVRLPNSRLKAFERDISEGHILLMVDVPKERVEEISTLIKSHHPEAKARGVDPSIPAFP
ncbi:MAG: DUF1269 domain-containing protein [Gammaproteobacteria bacterium]